MSAHVDIARTFGALLIGGLSASVLSGLVFVQVVIYFKTYTTDASHLKALVVAVWLLDTGHTICIWSSLWTYIIDHYSNPDALDYIHWNISLTIVLTAILTLLVHLFFAHRIFLLSRKNYWVTAPIVLLAVLRLVSASVTTGEMLHLGTFSRFKHDIRWIFTTGLALSSIVDILITASLFDLLQSSRTGAANLNAIIDSLIWYTFETGSLTTAGTIISMICWLAMPNNFIFMGLHFVIGKFYAGSLLITLNTRENIRRARSQGSGDPTLAAAPVHILDARRRVTSNGSDQFPMAEIQEFKGTKSVLEVNVERSIIQYS